MTLLMHSIESVLSIIIMFMTGFFMTKAGWINEETGGIFSKIILRVSLPAYMIYNICSTFTRAKLLSYVDWMWIPFAAIFLCYIISIVVSNVCHVQDKRKGVFRSIFFTSNTIFIGLPVNMALFGSKSVPFVLLYYIANTSIFWTIGAYEISRDKDRSMKVSFFSKKSLKRICSPVLLGFMSAIVLVLLGVRLPEFILSSCEYLGNLTTPLAMLFIGIVLYRTYRHVKIDRDTILLIAGRFILSPALVILLTFMFKTPSLMAKVFVIQAAMPAMTNTNIVAKSYGADYEFSTVVTVVTTVLSMVFIPLYMMLIH